MALTPGTRLGPYEILSALGAGGMGEVYRATDTALGRQVAIKVLPEAFAQDVERLARFEREAKTLASLNHPHIAQIYGLEKSSGVQALVMELVEGEDLSQRIARGPIPIDEALPIAKQIAEALEAAHEQGIIHRDLKPANIKVRADGTVKELDFGLAKAMDSTASSTANATMSPTLSMHATQAGIILGTAAYMSPEQARGAPVDRRADIWAFGVVLFEMLIGGRLFEGDTVSDTLAAVLRQDIDWSRLPVATPSPVVRMLRRCTDRNPKRRLRDIGEARIALETPGGDVPSALASGTAPAAAIAAARARFSIVHLVALISLVALAGAAAQLWRISRIVPQTMLRASATLPPGVSFDLVNRPVIAISRDGSTMAVVGLTKDVDQLYVRPLGEFEPRLLPGTDGASGPFFSPDGAWIGFFAEGKLKKIATAGGPVITLAEAPEPRGAVWTEHDTIIVAPNTITPLMELPAAGGTPRPLTTLDAGKHERTHRWPSLLPDGRTVLFNVGSVEHPDDYDDATIEAIRTDTGERRVVLKGGRAGQYVPTGNLVFLRGKVLYAVAFDEKSLEVRGSPTPIADGVSGDTTTGAAHYSVSDGGTLVYVPGDLSGVLRRLAFVDQQGKPIPVDAPSASYADPHPSPDGRRVAVSIIDAATSSRDIWVIDTVRGTSSRLTFRGINRTPLWLHDGLRVYYVSYDALRNVSVITVKAADGSGEGESIREFAGQAYLDDVSPGGEQIVLDVSGNGGQKQTMYRVLVKGGEPDVIVRSNGNLGNAAISPDGQWLAYFSDESGRFEVYAQSFMAGGSRSQVSINGGVEPHWAPNGRALYYQQNSQLVKVSIEPGPAFVASKPTMLFGGIINVSFDSRQTYNVMPDGNRFIMMRPPNDSQAAPEVRIMLNWVGDLKR